MARTNIPMFTSESEAAAWHMPLADHIVLAGDSGYWSAAGEVADAVEVAWLLDADDDAQEQLRKSAVDAVNNAWSEGFSHDEWVSAALRLLRGAGSDLVLVRSDAGDGGWSLHAAGSTDEQIARGAAPALLTGEAKMVDGKWNAPTQAHRAAAALIARQ